LVASSVAKSLEKYLGAILEWQLHGRILSELGVHVWMNECVPED
jgi:hypothetical protein